MIIDKNNYPEEVISATTLLLSITKVDDDTYTFSVSSDTATTGNTKGGGGRASAGPVSVTN